MQALCRVHASGLTPRRASTMPNLGAVFLRENFGNARCERTGENSLFNQRVAVSDINGTATTSPLLDFNQPGLIG
jgi:hypothetical protein